MNKAILNIDVQEFIQRNISSDIRKISLSKSPFPEVSPKELARQIDGKKRCETKLPSWYNTQGIYYPEKLALEQCSSEAAAKYKSALIVGSSVIDLTGGFGVDAAMFSNAGASVTHCEIDKELSDISRYNSDVLRLPATYINADGIEHLRSSAESYSTIYIDPSRRISSRKVFMLADCVPNVINEKDLLCAKCERLIIKTSPLLDLQATIKEIGYVSEIHVLSSRNECKEVLYIIDPQSPLANPRITCAILGWEKFSVFTFTLPEERSCIIDRYSTPLSFLYEPDVSLLKAGCFKLITHEFGVMKMHQHTHLYTSDNLIERFMGRRFKVLNTWDYGSFGKMQRFTKANVICRNFPQSPENVRKKLKISDGGSDYLLFCTGPINELLVIHCKRLD